MEILNEDNPIEDNNFFRFINFSVLTEIVDLIGKCPACKDNHIAVISVAKERMGFATKLKLFCTSCFWEKFFFTSEECFYEKKRGRNYYEVNVRAVTAFREIGRGHQAILNFSRCMNMEGLSKPAYDNINDELHYAYENATNKNMSKAAEEVKTLSQEKLESDTNISLCQCSTDGS